MDELELVLEVLQRGSEGVETPGLRHSGAAVLLRLGILVEDEPSSAQRRRLPSAGDEELAAVGERAGAVDAMATTMKACLELIIVILLHLQDMFLNQNYLGPYRWSRVFPWPSIYYSTWKSQPERGLRRRNATSAGPTHMQRPAGWGPRASLDSGPLA
ncbi:hypothetical protein BHE74_00000811 [Ensete ventricosum]|nr:hypothetical protein BHE74_00000811 [Ensete ventricosum]